MKEFFSFLKTKTFLKHFGIALVALCIILYLLFKLLSVYTNHGEMVEVPDFKGKPIAALDGFVEGKDLRYQIVDSIYSPEEKPGVVLKQDPLPNVKVKHNRTIYLYVTSKLPPMMKMPQLVDLSLKMALPHIQSYGLKAGKVKYVPGDKGRVIKQFVDGKEQKKILDKNGELTWPEYLVKKGSKVELVVGEGESSDRVDIPDLTGKTLEEAIQTLNNKGLSEGAVSVDNGLAKNTKGLVVYKQEPSAADGATIRIGSVIDLYLSK
ncbi:MAG: PASTA domain-containing protein [Bacteroidia bacterium]|nr:PASTA domain-containing protein [Bacteroidia bacterium]